MIRTTTRALALALVLTASGAAAQTAAVPSPALIVRDAALRVVVTPEDRADVSATLRGGSGEVPAPTLRREGSSLVVDGGLRDRIRGCGTGVTIAGVISYSNDGDDDRSQDRVRVRIEGVGSVRQNELPLLDVRVPMHARVEVSGAVFGAIGRTESVSLSNSGCGHWTVANTRGGSSLTQLGSGDIRAGSSGRTQALVRGSGDVALVSVSGPLTAEVVGSGDVRVQSVAGPVTARVRGSGDVRLNGGAAQGLDGEVHGSGDLRVATANGAVRLATYGSGDAVVDGGRATRLQAEVRGSGDVRFGGTTGAASAAVNGSGDIRIAEATGPVARAVRGSGDIYVNGASRATEAAE